jgi:hypothetical protein
MEVYKGILKEGSTELVEFNQQVEDMTEAVKSRQNRFDT